MEIKCGNVLIKPGARSIFSSRLKAYDYSFFLYCQAFLSYSRRQKNRKVKLGQNDIHDKKVNIKLYTTHKRTSSRKSRGVSSYTLLPPGGNNRNNEIEREVPVALW